MGCELRMGVEVVHPLSPAELRRAALIAAGRVAEAEEPTPEEVAELRELLDALGVAW